MPRSGMTNLGHQGQHAVRCHRCKILLAASFRTQCRLQSCSARSPGENVAELARLSAVRRDGLGGGDRRHRARR
eukprot:6182831-Pleurochrysis_carterae.AAC.3